MPPQRSQWFARLWGIGPALLFLAVFYAYPLSAMVRVSLARAPQGVGPLLWAMFTSPGLWQVTGFTLYQAFVSTALTLLLGLPGAYWLARYHFPGQTWLRALTSIPFVLPTMVTVAAFSAWLGPQGWVNTGLRALGLPPVEILGTFGAIVLAHVFYNTTIVLRVVGDFWARLDPRLPAAARVLGASRWQAFRAVTWPLLQPAVGAAALLVFLFNFTSFGVILGLGGPQFATLEVEIYQQTLVFLNLPRAAVLALWQLLLTLGLIALQTRWAARLSPPLNTRSATQTRRPLPPGWARWGATLTLGFIALLLIAPLLALLTRSLVRFDPAPQLTLDYYTALTVNSRASAFFVPPLAAIGNSLRIAGLTVLVSLALGLPAAWALARPTTSPRWRALVETGLLLPFGTSAVTLGLGFMVAWAEPPFDWRASPWLLPLAHTLIALPFVVRSLTPALRALKPRWRQAAAVLGASPFQAWLAVELPLVSRALIVAATFAFMLSLGEFGATALLTRPDQPTIPIVIYRYLATPGALNYGQALALSALLALTCAAGIGVMEGLEVRE